MQKLQQLKPLQQLKQMKRTITRGRLLNSYPSSVNLIVLCSNLLYKSHLILNNKAKGKKGKDAREYSLKSLYILKILDDYENNVIDMKEFNSIKKEFGVKNSDD